MGPFRSSKPKGDPVHELPSDFLAQFHFIISHHVDILHIILQLYATMALHSSHITNFHIIQTVYTFFIPYSGLFCRRITSWKGLSGPQKYSSWF